ncbi:hypothetical protein SDC9_51895 [bioreactor metagenome]|uniref:Uncharacterized protein n=1 Tax=bioreactor metagenome TaxID=1076179 RepID=A0A644WNY5_9ZZZZ
MMVAGCPFSSEYANEVPLRICRGFSVSSAAHTIPFSASKARTNELLPAPLGPTMAAVLISLNFSVTGTTFDSGKRLSLTASNEIV